MSKTYLVTGANSGLGLETVRQLTLLPDTKRVYMACRSEQKATAAIKQLAVVHGINTKKLQYIHFDASASSQDIVAAFTTLSGAKLDGVVMNAGGIGHDSSGLPVAPNQVLDVHQINIIGHIQLLEMLVSQRLLSAEGCRIVFSGSEGARGVPSMGVAKAVMGSEVKWYTDQLKGKYHGHDPMKAYVTTKGIGALYFAAWARRHKEYHVLTVSPGATVGTEALKADAVPKLFKVMIKVMGPVLKTAGVMHPVHEGAARYVRAVTGKKDMATFPSGTFVASKSKSGATGKVGDQSKIPAGNQFGDVSKQELAFAALQDYAELVHGNSPEIGDDGEMVA